ncbi:MFS transporter [Thalassomonas sp. M1454]|uniref:MFS transporter n=1 Tax=Thalassomonas sp. M1454 TaxID=2594477 RepID=UPI00117C4D31|nr:MFS transporter [Thalassomonas sp. M1454]TRX57847.1 MFS transporter [Thalassomonas sp. M1454]
MTQPTTLSLFDNPKAIAAAVIISIVGNAVFIGMPMLVGSLAETLGFDEQQLGWLASADLIGIFIASIATSLLVNRCNRQTLAIIGTIVAIIANYSSTIFHDFDTLFAIRIISGLGGGICYSVGVASLAGTHKTARNFSILLFALVAVNAIELYTFPSISDAWGVNGIFIFFCCAFIATLFFIPWLPKKSDVNDTTATDKSAYYNAKIPKWIPWLCLVAVACVYINVGAFWAFIERLGADSSLSDDFIANTLAIGTLFTLSGCAIATWMGNKFGQSKPLIGAFVLMTSILCLLMLEVTPIKYVIAATIFNFSWLFIDVFQLGTLGNIDHTGRYAALVPAAQGFTQSLSPAAAGYILTNNYGYDGVMMLCAVGTISAMLIYMVVYKHLRKIAPEIADAS